MKLMSIIVESMSRPFQMEEVSNEFGFESPANISN